MKKILFVFMMLCIGFDAFAALDNTVETRWLQETSTDCLQKIFQPGLYDTIRATDAWDNIMVPVLKNCNNFKCRVPDSFYEEIKKGIYDICDENEIYQMINAVYNDKLELLKQGKLDKTDIKKSVLLENLSNKNSNEKTYIDIDMKKLDNIMPKKVAFLVTNKDFEKGVLYSTIGGGNEHNTFIKCNGTNPYFHGMCSDWGAADGTQPWMHVLGAAASGTIGTKTDGQYFIGFTNDDCVTPGVILRRDVEEMSGYNMSPIRWVKYTVVDFDVTDLTNTEPWSEKLKTFCTKLADLDRQTVRSSTNHTNYCFNRTLKDEPNYNYWNQECAQYPLRVYAIAFDGKIHLPQENVPILDPYDKKTKPKPGKINMRTHPKHFIVVSELSTTAKDPCYFY